MVIGLYKAEAFRRFSLGSEICKTKFEQSSSNDHQTHVRQLDLKVQSFPHVSLSSLLIGAIQNSHVDLEFVVSTNDGMIEALQQKHLT
jgi:hypothetical protein